MRSIALVTGLMLLTAMVSRAFGETAAVPVQPVKPRTYALIAAIGDEFSVVTEEESIGSRLKGSRRERIKAPDNILNRIALQSLDKVVSQIDPASKRTYLMLGAPEAEKIASMRRESDIVGELQAQLAKIPRREQWDMMLVATPANRRFDHAGMADNLQGFGVVTAPILGGNFFFPRSTNESDFSRQHRAEAVTPENKTALSKTYLAPYSYIQVWVLDAKDLTVLGKQQRFDSQKLADPQSGSLDVNQIVGKEFLARQLLAVVEGSLREALLQTEITNRRGIVEIGDVNVVKPENANK